MKTRCKKNYSQNKYYYQRGVSVCDEWKSFEGFWEDMKDTYADDLTIDRIDNDKNYCKENCRWLTPADQCLNKTTNRLVTFRGQTKPLKWWTNEFNIPYEKTRKRLNRGWSVERAFDSCAYQRKVLAHL